MEKYWFLCHNIVSLMLEESNFFCGWFLLLHVSFNPTKLYGTFTMRVVLFFSFASLSASYSSNMILKVRVWLFIALYLLVLSSPAKYVYIRLALKSFPENLVISLEWQYFVPDVHAFLAGSWEIKPNVQPSWVTVALGESLVFFRDFFRVCMWTYNFLLSSVVCHVCLDHKLLDTDIAPY